MLPHGKCLAKTAPENYWQRSMQTPGHTRISVFSRLLAIALLAQLLVAVAGAAAPSLHHFLHHDSDHADHECAITLIAAGGVESVAVTINIAPLPGEMVSLPAPAPVWVASVFRLARVLEHAPPLA
jgi:hypothetical protein